MAFRKAGRPKAVQGYAPQPQSAHWNSSITCFCMQLHRSSACNHSHDIMLGAHTIDPDSFLHQASQPTRIKCYKHGQRGVLGLIEN
eukprot:1158922-Pelagomonas_calceolata.AAC.11